MLLDSAAVWLEEFLPGAHILRQFRSGTKLHEKRDSPTLPCNLRNKRSILAISNTVCDEDRSWVWNC